MCGEPNRPPSARVRLEVAFLDDAAVSEPVPAARDEPSRFTALIVAADPDVRRYLGECLRVRTEIRVYEAATIPAAAEIISQTRTDFLIVDRSEGLEGLPHLRTIVIVDEVPYGVSTRRSRIRLLARPFSAEQLALEVDQLLLLE